MEHRIPVTILGGFLGSGKTTLLNRLLSEPGGRRIAVIVNEFGEVGIDGAQVAGAEQFVELDNGCLCCAINEDLKKTLADLRARGGFDALVVETTGLADPLGVAWTFSRPGLDDYFRVDAIVTLIDARSLERALAEAPEATVQIERGDLLVLNKLDLVDDGGAAALAKVREINPRSPVIEARFGDVPYDVVVLGGDVGALAGDVEPHHHPSFTSWVFRTDSILSDEALEDLMYELPANVYRMKGIVRTDAEADWTLVNGVAGRFDLEPFETADPPPDSRLVFLGRDLDEAELHGICEALLVPST